MIDGSSFGFSCSAASALDESDPLRSFRSRFHIPEHVIYLDGNSLGLLSRDAEESLLRVLDEWKHLGIRGWLEGFHPWFTYAEELGRLCAPLAGAEPDEVVATGTTTLNIYSLAGTFYQPAGRRRVILADELTFPADLYALRSLIRLRGGNPEDCLRLVPGREGRCLDESDIIASMDQDTALIFLPSVLYRSGQLLDIPRIAAAARERGIPAGFDCSHSLGAIPHRFDEWNVDFALWCSYKYLNGGPGSTAFIYLNRRHFQQYPALTGWFGYVKERQFDLALEFDPARCAGGWQISSPAILNAAPLEGSLRMFQAAGMAAIREKSLKITGYLMYLVDQLLSEPPFSFRIGTPREDHRRGGHVALEHPEAMRISGALRARGVIPDFRPPGIIRIAPVALYNSYLEVWQLVRHLGEIMETREYEKLPPERPAIS